MQLNTDMQAIVDMISSAGAISVEEGTVEAARQMASGMTEFGGAGPTMRRVESLSIPATNDHSVAARLLVPAGELKGVIAYFHGGGWVLGDLDAFDALGRVLAVECGCAVVLVDYRLAPEHRFPAAAQDALMAVSWLSRSRESLFGKSLPLIVAGDSAGGNLAAVVAQQLQNSALQIAAQILIYPVTDANFDTASYEQFAEAPILTRAAMMWYWDQYLPEIERRTDPLAAPIRCADLRGLPPAIIITAEVDPIRDEAEAYADALEKAGVYVARQRFAGVTHGFFGMVNLVAASREAVRYAASELSGVLRSVG
jgi:acetyl esterase